MCAKFLTLPLTQRRLGQIGEVIGAVEDVAEDEEQESPIAEKRVEEAHDIIHRCF